MNGESNFDHASRGVNQHNIGKIQDNNDQSFEKEQKPLGLSFQGEKITDQTLKNDPNALIGRSMVSKPVKLSFEGETITLSPKRLKSVEKDLNILKENPQSVSFSANGVFEAAYAKTNDINYAGELSNAAVNEFSK